LLALLQSSKKEDDDKLCDSNNLNLVTEKEILTFKNISSSPMVFATKILMKLFTPEEMHGHNVSGKTFSKNIKNKKALDEKRIRYIRWLVENNFESNNREQLWKMCRTAINKIILINEKKLAAKSNNDISKGDQLNNSVVNNSVTLKSSMDIYEDINLFKNLPTTTPEIGKTTIVKLNDSVVTDERHEENEERYNDAKDCEKSNFLKKLRRKPIKRPTDTTNLKFNKAKVKSKFLPISL
jgi:hypothetical protein